jgi:hypothetical protein
MESDGEQQKKQAEAREHVNFGHIFTFLKLSKLSTLQIVFHSQKKNRQKKTLRNQDSLEMVISVIMEELCAVQLSIFC